MCFDCSWEKVASAIDDMLDDPDRFGFAAEFLDSVRRQAREKMHVTPRQKDAVRNVYRGGKKQAEKREEEKTSRRYEGFDDSRHGR